MDSNSTTAQHLIMAEAVEALGLREKLIEMGWVPPKEAALLMARSAVNSWTPASLSPPRIGQVVLLQVDDMSVPVVVMRQEDGRYHEVEGSYSYSSKDSLLFWIPIPRQPIPPPG